MEGEEYIPLQINPAKLPSRLTMRNIPDNASSECFAMMPFNARRRSQGRRNVMTTRSAFPFGILCFFAVVLAQLDAAQKTSEARSVAGNWTITAHMPGGNVTEQWTIQQKGQNVTGTAKAASGQLPVSGTFDPEGLFLRVDVKDGDKTYKVRATLDGDVMDGSITVGVGKEYLWFAKRTK